MIDFIILLSQVSLITPLVSSFVLNNFMFKEITLLLSNLLGHANYLNVAFKYLKTEVSIRFQGNKLAEF